MIFSFYNSILLFEVEFSGALSLSPDDTQKLSRCIKSLDVVSIVVYNKEAPVRDSSNARRVLKIGVFRQTIIIDKKNPFQPDLTASIGIGQGCLLGLERTGKYAKEKDQGTHNTYFHLRNHL
jgi:hypothetical protein